MDRYRALLKEADDDFLEDIVELYDQKLENYKRRLSMYNLSLIDKYQDPARLAAWNKETEDYLTGFAIGVRADRVYFRSAFFELQREWNAKFDQAKSTREMELLRIERDKERTKQLESQCAGVDKFYDQEFTKHTKRCQAFFKPP